MYAHNLFLERTQRAIVDGVAAFVAVLIAVWIRHGSGLITESVDTPWALYLFPAVVVAGLTVIVLLIAGSYREPHRALSPRAMLAALVISTTIALALSFFYRQESYSRVTVLIFIPVAALVLTATHTLYQRYVEVAWRTQASARRVVIVGHTGSGRRLAAALAKQPVYYDLVGFVDTVQGDETEDDDVIGAIDALGRIIESHDIDEVLICLPDDPDLAMQAIGACMRHRVMWKAIPNMYGLKLDRITVDRFDEIPLVGPHSTQPIGFSWMMKRGFDIAVASVALIILSPVLAAAAIAVRLSSRGPIIFRQSRVGINGEPFTMLKFRTMKTGASTDIHNDYTAEWIYGRSGNGNGVTTEDTEPELHKMTDDPRITSVGKVLRATSVDELPQFWNVLRGDMSVVGPRPALQYEVDRYTEWHKRRLTVKPGITGAWQVSGRNNLSFDNMVALDVEYIETWSIGRDFEIMLRTVPAVLKLGGE